MRFSLVVAAAGDAGEHGAVVGELAGRDSPAQEGFLEGVDDVGAGDGAARDRCQGEPGVVVEEVEDLRLGAVGQVPAGGVGLREETRLPVVQVLRRSQRAR